MPTRDASSARTLVEARGGTRRTGWGTSCRLLGAGERRRMDGPRVVAAWSRRQKLRRRWRGRALASGSTSHSQPAAGSPEVRPDARLVRRGARSQPWNRPGLVGVTNVAAHWLCA